MFEPAQAFNSEFIHQPSSVLWESFLDSYAIDESSWLEKLLQIAKSPDKQEPTRELATQLVSKVRGDRRSVRLLDSILLEYSLNTREGILLMSLSEALIRIPDPLTVQALIEDKLVLGNWRSHRGRSKSMLVNTATWSLLLTGKLLNLPPEEEDTALRNMLARYSAPVIRTMIRRSMQIIGQQFVLGENVTKAIARSKSYRKKGYTYTFDMLGEAALTAADAEKYKNDYLTSIATVGQMPALAHSAKPSVSIKLSAIHPRYDSLQEQRVMDELVTTVKELVVAARKYEVALTIDAEEMDRLELSMRVFEAVYRSDECQGWGQFGVVVQAYAKRALPQLCYLAALAKEVGTIIPVRLVKGAYWDYEIKSYQQRGLTDYPVFTRKEATDVNYFSCAQFLLNEVITNLLAPQFATHNAQTIASIIELPAAHDFEFQRLHGMGDTLYDQLLKDYHIPVRIYAPVGAHKELLPYLVRRLLENGANNSFVHRLIDPRCAIEDIVEDPITKLENQSSLANQRIKLPPKIYGASRPNSQGVNLHVVRPYQNFALGRQPFANTRWQGGPIIENQLCFDETTACDVMAPHDHTHLVGQTCATTPEQLQTAIATAGQAFPEWNQRPTKERTQVLRQIAQLYEENRDELIVLCQKEAGKTLQDAIDEIREAVDFCYYYAQQAELDLAQVRTFADYLGQKISVAYQGRGVFACISPWNFPLAIFTGQIVAALVSGNAVVAKGAPQTSLIATRAVQLMQQAGLPLNILQLVTGDVEIGQQLIESPEIAGVAFTGSLAAAQSINRGLAERGQLPVPLIAETGGQNAMIVDSSALPEQVIKDVLRSAFASAGQRCSALRLLCVQEEIADTIITQLKGAMHELNVGDPSDDSTDIGPVIDEAAYQQLTEYQHQLQTKAQHIASAPCPESSDGWFIAPCAYEINSISDLGDEQFGPILHVIRFPSRGLNTLIDKINQLGYGLTLGIHSRIENRFLGIARAAEVGNCYINRDQVGATVGAQPFGGRGLSGTGPKAGGPNYLFKFNHAIYSVKNDNEVQHG